MNSDNISKRKEINNFLIKRRIKNSNEDNILKIKNNYVDIISVKYDSGRVKYKFYYVCELDLCNINETIYAYTNNLKKYLDIFSNNIMMDNPIDQNLHIDLSIRDIQIEFENDKIKFYKSKYPHRYADNKEKIVLGKLNYHESIEELNDKSSRENNLVSFEDFISKDIKDIILDEENCKDAEKKKKQYITEKYNK